MIIDDTVIEAIKENIPLAPLHNPPNLEGIEVSRKIFPESPQVAVFDTAFHQTLPMRAYLYAIPYRLYKKDKVRRYGFHGTSHAYVAEKAADFLGRDLDRLNLITIHLGNGASMAAIKNGKCIDTTMGMTPLEGLVMGTRSGDVDPAIPFFLAGHLGMSLREIDSLLNKESGLKGICETNDMREVIDKMESGDNRAEIAIDIYTYRIKKYIGAYFAALGHLDGIVFTAGIGENSPHIRKRCCCELGKLGIEIDPEKNYHDKKGIREINTPGSEIKVLVVPSNEELKIALETQKVIEKAGRKA
jgi:acetate kinase